MVSNIVEITPSVAARMLEHGFEVNSDSVNDFVTAALEHMENWTDCKRIVRREGE